MLRTLLDLFNSAAFGIASAFIRAGATTAESVAAVVAFAGGQARFAAQGLVRRLSAEAAQVGIVPGSAPTTPDLIPIPQGIRSRNAAPYQYAVLAAWTDPETGAPQESWSYITSAYPLTTPQLVADVERTIGTNIGSPPIPGGGGANGRIPGMTITVEGAWTGA